MKTSIIFLLFFCILHNPFAHSAVASGNPEIKKIRAYARKLLLSDTAYATEQSYRLTDDIIYDTDGNGYFKSMTPEGNWGDIDYASQMRSSWKPSWHLYRTMLICREYYKNRKPEYLAAVHRSMAFWIRKDLICENWWQNNINTPFTYTSLILMLGDDVLKEETDYLNKVIIKRIPVHKATGQNLIWQLDNEARVALINEDRGSFSGIMQRMQEVISVTVQEGIQPDYSFHQHGPMLQFGNYGMHFTNSLLFWMTVTSKTSVAFAPQKQNIIFDYISKGLRWTIYKKAMDITAVGRQIRANSGLKRGENLAVNSLMVRTFDKGKACGYYIDGFKDAEQGKCKIEGNKSFWRSDYMIDRKDNKYMMSVKAHGPFVSRVESINGENLKGTYLNDGVTLFQRSGKEYRDIEALWNWAMLPGTTGDTTANPLVKPAPNKGVFTGQVSNEREGILAMDYDRKGIKARKSYFFSNGSMVALGTDISAPNMKNIATVVDQKFYNATAPLSSGKGTDNSRWLWTDSVAYIFPDPETGFKTKIEKRKESWYDVDNASSREPVSGSLFTVYVPHNEQNKYLYVVKPAIGLADAKKINISKQLKALSNTAQVQAIELDMKIMAVFYSAGTINLSNKSTLKVDQSCMLMLDRKNDKNILWLSDPTRKLKNITVTIDGASKVINFPSDDYLGNTVQYVW
ncbi:polysaccharide lyase family 8 super-sandwich domain-containing protein [Pedobacter sp. R-06]|uniref:polysaccharide lyase family 8 super-sandwich domain-containing protein n=1 Tax=Pedobacter sp. R-06 TaxID=3404051 RepID=UPI003CF06CED